MKELNKLTQQKIEVQIKKQQQIEREHLGTIRPHENHIVFEIDPKTLKIEKAMYIEKDIVFGAETEKKSEVLVRDGFHYVSALNKKNALKKYKKGKNGSKKQEGFIELSIY